MIAHRIGTARAHCHTGQATRHGSYGNGLCWWARTNRAIGHCDFASPLPSLSALCTPWI